LLTNRADAQAPAPLAGIEEPEPSERPVIKELTISLSQSDASGSRGLTISPNGTFTTRNYSLRGVIGFAYGLQEGEIIERGASVTDLASNRYNITARAAGSLGSDRTMERQYRLMVRRLLAEQFGLEFHYESQRMPVYALTLDPARAGLRAAEKGDPGPLLSRGANSVQGYAVPMLLLKQYLSNQLKRPLLDQTGLTERYNFRMKWGPEAGEADAPPASNAFPEPSREVLVDALEKQLGLSLISQDGEVKRLIVDRLRQPATLIPPPVEVAADVSSFDRHVGNYDYPPKRSVSIYREDNRLYALLTGQPPLQIYAQSADSYFAKLVEVNFTFVRGTDGATTELVVTQGPQITRAPKIDDAVAKMREDALAQRIRGKIPQSGTERALWDYLRSLAADKPIYDRMTKSVAEGVRAEWPTAKSRFEKLGALGSIKLKSVGPAGADLYLATFEHGASEWRISLSDEGLIEILSYRRITASQ
ncbi:MAG TPA: TIGR03435 family protein, partial [Steroidobacteraceae bacterium]|nr:TIGR03435 family protein [Steroidobacteraceae bacterium]